MQDDQLEFDLRGRNWGGHRTGAGRKKSKVRRDPLHRTRPHLTRHTPVHVVLRVKGEVGRLRRGPIYQAIRRAMLRVLGRSDFRLVHASIQHNHLHFLFEADDREALTSGMQGLVIAAARAINRACGRRGKVFEFRYHATKITLPKQARHALAYVLNNWRRHREDFGCEPAERALVDPYSTGISFTGWRDFRSFVIPDGYEPLPVVSPQSWLLAIGWQRYGAIGFRERPGPLS
jgi:REP element-mobilizing transposase RayT